MKVGEKGRRRRRLAITNTKINKISSASCIYLYKLEKGDGRQALQKRIMERARRVRWVCVSDAEHHTRRFRRPVRCCERKSVVCTGVDGVQLKNC